jgi:hypothetical protein
MKKKPRGQNVEIIRNYLLKYGPTGAADIQKATKVKGNIYTTLQTMVNRKIIKKVGKVYQPTIETTIKHDIGPAFKAPQPTPNPYANILKREHDHIMQGIQQLQVTANYINLRIRELERANQTS